MSYILVFMAGTFVGVCIMCAMVSAGEADDREERWFDGRHNKSKKGD